MCGISGLIYTNRDRSVDRNVLERMNGVIAHRGPDSDGFFVDRNVGLAMRRLAIIDLVSGDQPIANENETAWVVFNGEIYNFPDLRRELESKGHSFKTNTDTESIVHLYEEYGLECVNHLRGMFAFALWDVQKQRLMLARDRGGQKPLYYAEHDGGLIFGSEIKCLLEYPNFPRTVDLEAIDHYLTLQYVPDPWTGFKHIRKLPPAHTLTLQEGSISVQRYWDLPYTPKLIGSEDELIEELRSQLREAVRIRMISDVPLGAHLSGGIDSSLIVALMAEHASRPVKTFSIGFDEENFSELEYARAVAERYGTDHHEFKVSYGDVPATFEKIMTFFDEPFADSSALPMYFLSCMTREHVTVALNGDGGDELFAGYQRYALDRFANIYSRLPGSVTRGIVPALARLLPEPVNVPIEANPIAGLKRLGQVADTSREASIVRWGSYFNDRMKRDLWRKEVRASFLGSDSSELLSESFRAATADSFLDRTLYSDTTNYLPGDLLVKADRMTMAHSLEGRSPFLDHVLMEWAARLPEKMKLRGRAHKVILKKAFAKALPQSVTKRGKQGFGIPLGAWFRGPLADWTNATLLDPNAGVRTLFQPSAIDRLMQEHAQGRTDHGKRIWTLLALELWWRQLKPER
jgi:asparagine synthase (glutamine-hydrolysing)